MARPAPGNEAGIEPADEANVGKTVLCVISATGPPMAEKNPEDWARA